LAIARLSAKRAGLEEPGARHLLLALLHEEEGRAAVALRQQGVSPDSVRTSLGVPEPVEFDLTTVTGDRGRLSLGFERVLANARSLALELAVETTVSSEHVLVALLQHEPELARALEPVGLDLAKLKDLLRKPQSEPLILVEPLELVEASEQIDLARVLDANANRAREGLRVVEDFCRFVLDDAFLSGEWKTLRHDFAAAIADLEPRLLLEARETQRDVGTALGTPAEEFRASTADVLQANVKRLGEALRSLEEYGKIHHPKLGRAFEALRYRVYTLERVTLLSAASQKRLDRVHLYLLVTGSLCTASIEWTIQEAVAGGVQMVQLREKELPDRELVERARNVRRWTRQCGAIFIMNDRPDIARLVEADGVHVGQDELTVKDARRIIGPNALIGVSTHTIDQARQAVLDGASYIGVGPTFPSATKSFEVFAGLDFVRQVAAEIRLPAFAIGGINAGNIDQVVQAGLRRAAVSHAICQADEPRLAAVALRQALDKS
jgi:thiamine-phosphate pyrophosphorylase